MFKYAINLVLRRKFRTFLTSLGITISVVLLSLIIFGMMGLRDVITNQFSQQFNPNEIIVSNQDFSSFGFGGGPAEEEDGESEEPTIITPKLLSQIEEEDAISKVESMINVLNFEISLKGSKKKSLSPGFIVGLKTIKDSSYDNNFIGNKTEASKNEIFAGNVLAEHFGLEPNEIIGKTLVLKPSVNTILSQRSAGIADLEYQFKVVGYFDAGIDRVDAILDSNRAADIVAKVGNFKNGKEYLEEFGYDQLIVEAKDEKIEEVENLIKDKYNLRAITSDEILSFLDQITTVLTFALSLFAMVAAVVASIGIVNTMVMSIYEQTKEIGINKAIGASDFQILIIFLIQSGVIGFIGGLTGLIIVFLTISVADPVIVEELGKQGFELTNFFSFDLKVCSLIILASIAVGILAGIYPALKAARLDPVKALRYE